MDDVEIIGEDMTENKEYKVKSTKIDKPLNRIIFGAPGTGKSHKLAEDCKKYFPEENQIGQLTAEEIVRRELSEVGNNYSKCYALGFAFADFIKTQTPKILRESYGCNREAAYITYQGGRAVDFYNKELSSFTGDEKDSKKILEALKKIPTEQSMKEAGSAAVGRKFSSYLYGKSISEICGDLGLAKTETQSRFIWIGANSVDYDFKTENKSIKYTDRVTFHPNYSYAQFVGTYKPVSEETEDGKNEISYKYVPGPFMRVCVNAVKNHENNYLLLIEEINRANVAAVFGDVFQLLDRNAAGESEYPVAASEDIKKYLLSKGISSDELKIPSNMYIWATMNSADQGVMPMDAAFKRRWDFEYLDIDAGKFDIEIPIPNGTDKDGKVNVWENVKWNELRTAINNTLKKIPGVNEDKLLGPFFIGNKDRIEELKENNEKFNKLFKSKVLMYLFEDVVKMNPGDLFDIQEGENIHYSDICKKFDEQGLKVFVKSVSEVKTGESN